MAEGSVSTSRRMRAEEYFNDHLDGQLEWYDNKASRNKKWAFSLSATVLTAGALSAFLQVFSAFPELEDLIPIATAFLGLLVVIGKGAEQMGSFESTWVTYRRASESMKRERRLFVSNGGSYRSASSEEQAYALFVQRVEQTIAEEQQIYWSDRVDDSEEKHKESETH